MASGPTIEIPHTLGRQEVRRRLANRIGELPQHIPGGVAQMTTAWPGEDRMTVHIVALGQSANATIDIEDRIVRVGLILPPILSFMSGAISAAIQRGGEELLLPDHSG
ncbi:polyhydroxyalkanoic acid system family protein [Sphingomonas sp. PR090111-T3T-6A]|uniref:polyhydroxyalkanoic acid system family protein n=1 Tax=Sphingomonas sp. PR090111-T3T-6A TaxID=685778 RepID=UPI00036BF7A1|nr:polyhydroxyalkanoic acid system family protein [Sphingomonas sp. PR090111-T3T-6A]